MPADIGIPEDRVRLLTRAEAGALAAEVQSAKPEDKAAKVAGLQDLYGALFGSARSSPGAADAHRSVEILSGQV